MEARGTGYAGLFHAVDWMPTLLQCAGSPVDRFADGVGMWERLSRPQQPGAERGQNAALARTVIPINIEGDGASNTAFRSGDWKLIIKPSLRYDGYFPAPPAKKIPAPAACSSVCLFNLTGDPEESEDVAAENPDVVQQLKGLVAGFVNSGNYSNGQDYTEHPEALPVFHRGVWLPWVH